MTQGVCQFGDSCERAHSERELCEWKERFERRAQQRLTQLSTNDKYSVKLMRRLLTLHDTSSLVRMGM